jgi:CheY-like chemotaxis protein
MGFSLTGKHYDRLIGDATRLRQVLTNLINNAVKFTEFGSIQVSAGVEQDSDDTQAYRLYLSVADTGIGIPADRMDRLFQSFSQVDASINRRFGGTGLGLAICKRLIEMMGGALIVESQLGLGTTFRFSIPISVAEPELIVVAELISLSPSQRILVVEDNPINCVVIRKMLEKLGHSVDLVSDGNTAIRRIQETECDLVFMDVNMPGLDGLEATRIVRGLPEARANVPIIALTASSLVNDRQACLQAGMNDFLSKPVSLDALRKVVERWAPAAVATDGVPISSEPVVL